MENPFNPADWLPWHGSSGVNPARLPPVDAAEDAAKLYRQVALESADGTGIAERPSESPNIAARVRCFRIFVRPFPNINDGRMQISSARSVRPLWTRSGRELFYLAPDGTLMSVSVAPGTTRTAQAPPYR